MTILFCNLLWAAANIPAWLRFIIALRTPKRAQERIQRRLAAERTRTSWHRAGVDVPPPTTYDDYRDAIARIMNGETNVLTNTSVLILEPTSGSTASSKLIPCTESLLAEFRNAIAPWIFSLYLKRPRLLFTRHYWSISPSMPPAESTDKVRIGFATDAEYLGVLQQHIARRLFPVPPEIQSLRNPNEFWFATALLLAADSHLGLISVWHPSFLRILTETIQSRREELAVAIRTGILSASAVADDGIRSAILARLRPNSKRAELVARFTPDLLQELWPRLQIISCWDSGRAAGEARRIRRWLPHVLVQGKGLLATEGVVTIPWGDQYVAAINSHVLEFQESESGRILPLHRLELGHEYEILLTTGGGFLRYRLGDRVRCTGFVEKTPALEFIGRTGGGCDLVGEKLTPALAELAIAEAEARIPLEFAMLAPATGNNRYELYIEDSAGRNPHLLASDVDASLLRNSFHYAHARRLGQLQEVLAVPIKNAFIAYRAALVSDGMQTGDIKALPLHPASNWRQRLET